MNQSCRSDLATCETAQEAQADICIIGAGAAGIYLATRLAAMGSSVVLLEAGSSPCVVGDAVGFECDFEASHYSGASTGRYFGVGGSTARWGGALVPHSAHDIREGDPFGDAWTAIVNAVSEHAPNVLERLGYSRGPDFEEFAARSLAGAREGLNSAGWQVIAGLMMPFRRRNLASLLEDSRGRSGKLRVFVNAVATSWRCSRAEGRHGRVDSVSARSRNGNEVVVSASRFVVAAGAIESARILLELAESTSQPIVRPTSSIGCYLADHLSAPIAELAPSDRSIAREIFSPRFTGSWMRAFRFIEMSPPPTAPRAFAHFVFSGFGQGFELVKDLLGALQRRRLPHVDLSALTKSGAELTKIAWVRYAKSALYLPPDTAVHLQLDMEQQPIRSNRVRLSSERDIYGRRRASISWQVSDSDMNRLSETAERILSRWPARKAGLPTLAPLRNVDMNGAKPHDAYHPVGTCRMGTDSEAVVDSDLRVWGTENLWVASTAVLPSAGTANPTFTLLCLTHRLAEHLRAIH